MKVTCEQHPNRTFEGYNGANELWEHLDNEHVNRADLVLDDGGS